MLKTLTRQKENASEGGTLFYAMFWLFLKIMREYQEIYTDVKIIKKVLPYSAKNKQC